MQKAVGFYTNRSFKRKESIKIKTILLTQITCPLCYPSPQQSFKTSKHLCSWAGLSPRNDESAGKIKSKKVMPGNPYVKSILCLVAWVAVKNCKNSLGNWFWAHQSRLGKGKAIIAASRKILTLSYALISNNTFYDNDYISSRLNE